MQKWIGMGVGCGAGSHLLISLWQRTFLAEDTFLLKVRYILGKISTPGISLIFHIYEILDLSVT